MFNNICIKSTVYYKIAKMWGKEMGCKKLA